VVCSAISPTAPAQFEFGMQKTLGLNRRRFCGAAATVAAGTLGSPFFQKGV
jgi:hypothetical protein